jgi:hypothetical protein
MTTDAAGWRALALLAVAVLVPAASCTGSGKDEATPTTSSTAGEEQPVRLTDADTPLDGLKWPGRAEVGQLLTDDGTTLWSVDPKTGRRTPVWKHPRLDLAGLAVDGGGRRVALTGTAGPTGAGVVYLLDSEGVVREAEALAPPWTTSSPVFLRSPYDESGRSALYWMARSDTASERTGTYVVEPHRLEHDGTVSKVEVALRNLEWVSRIDAFPGSPHFSVTLVLEGNPAAYEVLQNIDGYSARGSATSTTYWSKFYSRGFTQVSQSTVWLSPRDSAVFRKAPAGGPIDVLLFRSGCSLSSGFPEPVYSGTDVDDNAHDFLNWDAVALPPDRVLVLTASDAARIDESLSVDRPPPKVNWTVLSTKTGDLSPSPVEWTPGLWTWVAPDDAKDDREPDCSP